MRNRIWIVNTYSMGSQNLSICLNKLPFSITLIIETCCVTGIKYYTNSFDYKNELFALLLYNNEFCVTKFSWCNNHSICLIVSIKGQSHEKLSFCIEWKSLVAKIFPFLFFLFVKCFINTFWYVMRGSSKSSPFQIGFGNNFALPWYVQ